MKEKCKNRPKRHKKAPIPSATYRPAIGQLSASYRPATKKQRMQMCPFCVSHEQSGPTSSKGGGPELFYRVRVTKYYDMAPIVEKVLGMEIE